MVWALARLAASDDEEAAAAEEAALAASSEDFLAAACAWLAEAFCFEASSAALTEEAALRGR